MTSVLTAPVFDDCRLVDSRVDVFPYDGLRLNDSCSAEARSGDDSASEDDSTSDDDSASENDST